MKRINLSERVYNLRKLAALLENQRDALSIIQAREVGTSYKHFSIETDLALHTLRTADQEISHFNGRRPAGKVAIILPYNAPIILLALSLSASYLTGNETILKFSSKTRQTAQLLESLIEQSLGESVSFSYKGGNELIKECFDPHSDVHVIQIYGHDSWIQEYIALSRKSGKKLIFEGPGKDPAIILPDVDYAFIPDIVKGFVSNSGQVCMSLERCYVPQSILKEFMKALIEEVRLLKTGDPTEKDTDIGPVMSSNAVENIRSQFKDAIEKGANIEYGGNIHDNLVEPTIMLVNNRMRIMIDETFGPVIPICPYEPRRIDKAIALANEGRYALGSSVFGVDYAYLVAKKLRKTHSFCLENLTYLRGFNPHAPFGGYKNSGAVYETILGTFFKKRQGPRLLTVEFTR